MKHIRNILILILGIMQICACCLTAASEEILAETPVFQWKGYEVCFPFKTMEIEPYNIADTAATFFPDSVGNILLIRFQAAEGTIANADFQPAYFKLIMPDGQISNMLFHQVANMILEPVMMPDSQQDYFHLLFDKGNLTEETFGEASIAVYESEDGEPVFTISLGDIPTLNPQE